MSYFALQLPISTILSQGLSSFCSDSRAADRRPWSGLLPGMHEMKASRTIFSHQDHPITLDTPHFPRSQVGDNDNPPADDLLRFEMLRDTGNDSPLFITKIDAKFQQF